MGAEARTSGSAALAPLAGGAAGDAAVVAPVGAQPWWVHRVDTAKSAGAQSEGGQRGMSSRSRMRPITAPAALSWDESSREPYWDENSLASILSEMSVVKSVAARRARSERRKAREQEKQKRTGAPVVHTSRYGISTMCLYDSRGKSAASSWEKLPIYAGKKKQDVRRRRMAIAPLSLSIHPRPWLPVEQSGKLFGSPRNPEKKKKRTHGRSPSPSTAGGDSFEVEGTAMGKLKPLGPGGKCRPETR